MLKEALRQVSSAERFGCRVPVSTRERSETVGLVESAERFRFARRVRAAIVGCHLSRVAIVGLDYLKFAAAPAWQKQSIQRIHAGSYSCADANHASSHTPAAIDRKRQPGGGSSSGQNKGCNRVGGHPGRTAPGSRDACLVIQWADPYVAVETRTKLGMVRGR